MAKYYINTFNFFYSKNENLGSKFAKKAFNGVFGEESEEFDLTTILNMVARGFLENEKEFIDAYIDIGSLVNGTVKRVLG